MLKAASMPLFGFTYWKLHKKIKYDITCVILVINSLFGHHQLIGGSLCASSPPPRRRGGGHADPFVHLRIHRCILTQNLWSMFTKTKFPRKLGIVLIWNFDEMFLRPLGTALSYFFFKIAYFSRFRMISVGGRDMNSFSGMHERIRRCTKGSADAQKDPQMHKRIRRCTKGSAWRTPLLYWAITTLKFLKL